MKDRKLHEFVVGSLGAGISYYGLGEKTKAGLVKDGVKFRQITENGVNEMTISKEELLTGFKVALSKGYFTEEDLIVSENN